MVFLKRRMSLSSYLSFKIIFWEHLFQQAQTSRLDWIHLCNPIGPQQASHYYHKIQD